MDNFSEGKIGGVKMHITGVKLQSLCPDQIGVEPLVHRGFVVIKMQSNNWHHLTFNKQL
jgi:hypothetical protein